MRFVSKVMSFSVFVLSLLAFNFVYSLQNTQQQQTKGERKIISHPVEMREGREDFVCRHGIVMVKFQQSRFLSVFDLLLLRGQ